MSDDILQGHWEEFGSGTKSVLNGFGYVAIGGKHQSNQTPKYF